MTPDPWFDPIRYGWLPSTLLGVLGGTWGALVGSFASRGKARGLILGLTWFLLAAAVLLTIAGAVALATGQPYGVWNGLGLAGVIGLFVIGFNVPTVLRAYRMAEERKMAVEDAHLP